MRLALPALLLAATAAPAQPRLPDAPVDVALPRGGAERLPPRVALVAPVSRGWNEGATWKQYDSRRSLDWATPGGDVGEEVATLRVADDDEPGWVEVKVPGGGADFIVKRKGGTNAQFASRENPDPAIRPQFVTRSGRTLAPSADATLASSTVMPLGNRPTLSSKDGFLIRFDTREPGLLRLHTLAEYGDQTLVVSRVAKPRQTVRRPAWLLPDPTPVYAFAERRTVSLKDPDLTWFSTVRPIPARESACVTVYHKLHRDFRPGDGGKLPGLANTGMGYKDAAKTGWGGRKPDGVHWSARTGFGDWDDSHVARRTYFYAIQPKNLFGHVDSTTAPIAKGRFEAYVQCVRLNTPGVANGGLYYELAGHGPIYARSDIMWRTSGSPQSLIRELWIDYYCGGTQCGRGPRGTVTFVKALVTRGLPDMRAVEAEVARLNAQG